MSTLIKHQRLAAVEALAILLSLSYSEGAIGEASPQIVGSAWDAIALLAADATHALHGTARHRINVLRG